eukprot:NODE_247_length_11822_cov_1.182718.p10 type:complete len:191 gc:universal NODE_247_length_11822_cov_1.182718:3269-3841(+)
MNKQLYKFQTEIKVVQHKLKATFSKKKANQHNQRFEISQLLKDNRINHAKIKTEYVIRDDYIIEAMEIIELYLELILVRSQLIFKKDFDENCLEAIAGLIYSAPRLNDVPELLKLQHILSSLTRDLFKNKKDLECPELISKINPKLKRLVDMTRARNHILSSTRISCQILPRDCGCVLYQNRYYQFRFAG